MTDILFITLMAFFGSIIFHLLMAITFGLSNYAIAS